MITISRSNYESLKRYVEHRIPTGSFLQAVLENDLKAACGRADERNSRSLHAIVTFCYTYLPSECWSSPEKVRQWLNKHPDTSPDVPCKLSVPSPNLVVYE